MHFCRAFALVIVVLVTGPVWEPQALGQDRSPKAGGASATAPEAAKGEDRYSAEPAVVERWDTVYRYNADGTGTKETTGAIRLQTDAALRQYGVVSMPFASGTEHLEFDYVRVRRADGTVVETPISDAMEMPAEVTRQAPFYSDLKQKQIPVRSLRVGDVLEYRVREVQTKADAPDAFWGAETMAEDVVVLSQTLEIRIPKTKQVTMWSPKSKPEVTEEGADRVWRWTSSHLQPTAGKEAEARKEAEKGKVLPEEDAVAVRLGKLPTVAWTTFPSWEAVGAWYQGLEVERAVADADVKAKTKELIAGKTTDEDKARALYAYVSSQIRYIGVAFGVGRYQPHAAGEVLRNQYGDCKDKHTLLAAMLKEAGLRPSAVLIGAGIRFNDAVPSPAAFNHLITTVPVGGTMVWLDATQEVAPYRVLLYAIRDRKALVVPDAGVARVEQTPAGLPFEAKDEFLSVAKLDKEGTALSHISMSFRSDSELMIREIVHQVSPGQYEEFVQRLSQQMGFGGTTSHAEVSRPEATAEPMTLAYDYRREKPGDDWEHFRITPQLLPIGLMGVDEKDPPRVPIELGSNRVEEATSKMTLPEGWGATLPEAVHVRTDFAKFDLTYRFEKGTLFVDRRYEVLADRIPAENWKSYKSFLESAVNKSDTYIQLTGAHAGVGEPPLPTMTNAEAAKLVGKAQDALRNRYFDEAESSLKAAVKLNEKEPQLWSTYGSLEFMRGEVTKGIEDGEKELTLHPDELWAYVSVAGMQMVKGDRAGAESTLERDLKEGGSNAEVAMRLAALLQEDGASERALKVLSGVPAAEQTSSVRIAMAKAQIEMGHKSEAEPVLMGVLKEAKEPGELNNAAYELADAGLDLPVAEEASRRAVEELTKGTSGWTLEGDQREAMGRARLLLAAWDTYGWVLFREGKLADAEHWTRAAWLQFPSPEVGLHLGQIEEAQGQRAAALKTYREAIASIPLTGMEASQRPTGAMAKRLEARADVLKAGSNEGDAHRDLQALRTLKVGASEGRSGTAEFRLRIVAGRVAEAAGPGMEGKTIAGGEAMVKRLELKDWWPAGSEATVVRTGVLNCHQAVCELVLMPL